MAQIPIEDDEEDNDVAEGLYSIARALQKLGNGDASTHFGAIEGASMLVEEIGRKIADSLDRVADKVEDAGTKVADSLNYLDRVADTVEEAGAKVAKSLDHVAESLRFLAAVYAQAHSVTPEAR
jgi:hypothetical protein